MQSQTSFGNSMQNEKIEKERRILNFALPALESLYGSFTIDDQQQDAPDAAIILEESLCKVGIEITSVDPQKVQSYFNDRKITGQVEKEQIENLLKNGSFSKEPTKKMTIEFKYNYIFDGVIEKSKKYDSYKKNRKFHELVVLASSSYLEISSAHFSDYHKPWAEHLLGQNKYPFDKVIFVCETSGRAELIYDKSKPVKPEPKMDANMESGITKIHGPILPFGKGVNFNEIFDNAPTINPKK